MNAVWIVITTILFTILGLVAIFFLVDAYLNKRHMIRTKGVWKVELENGQTIHHSEIKTVEYYDGRVKSDRYDQPEETR